MSEFRATEPFARALHRVDGFRCGDATLDLWLGAYAGQGERRDATRTFVVSGDASEVLAYYTLVAGEIVRDQATESVRRGMSRRFPIPVAVIARLAVDERHQGRGLGRSLLLDALRRVERASRDLAVRVVLVDAADDYAATFYRRFGFASSELDDRTLMVTLAAVRRVRADS